MLDQNAALGLIDELRVAVPEEVRAAKRINSEGERIIEKAQDEAERIVAKAQEQAAFLIDERGLTQAAEAQSRQIIADAHADADEIRRGADEYAVSVLVGLEGDVVKTLQSIKKGIALLDERRATLEVDEPGEPRTRSRSTSRGRTRRASRPRPRGDRPAASDGPLTLERRRTPRRGTRRRARPTRSTTSTIDLGEDLRLADPIDGRVRLLRTNRGILASADLRDRARPRVQPLPARRSRSRRRRDSRRSTCPSLDLATGRPLPVDDEPDVAPPDRPSRARSRDAGPRGDPAGRADRAALPAGLPGPVHRLRRPPRRGRPRSSGRRHRPAAGGLRGFRPRRRLTEAPDSR